MRNVQYTVVYILMRLASGHRYRYGKVTYKDDQAGSIR
jgi:hypothetical protein